ncbi:energy transducer TonB [Acetobacter indonesiensis]|uniref:energy transducer TonB n=1 Tax=Acetobacter indonesiensis TaxID=104101 RepID=UPI000A3D3CED|nr:energy transducer TonB [Acetobacter indonesiensis]
MSSLTTRIAALALLTTSTLLSLAHAEPSDLGTPIPRGPIYPSGMVKKNVEAVVVVKTDIDTEGHTTGCHIVSTTNAEFNSSALDYCRKARYSPATKNGIPVVERDKTMSIRYKLNE